jgi:hypothetical protein
MRRLDWFLAAVVASFLIGVLAVHALGLRFGGAADPRFWSAGQADTTVRRLIIPPHTSSIQTSRPAAWAARGPAEVQS